MRIACPDCNAVYELPPERVRPGRGVKCAKCGTVWVPVALIDSGPEIPVVPDPVPVPPPPTLQSEPQPEPPPEPEPVTTVAETVPGPASPPALPVRRRSQVPVLLAWVLTLIVLAALGWAFVTQRAAIIQAWPPAERAYGWMRLH